MNDKDSLGKYAHTRSDFVTQHLFTALFASNTEQNEAKSYSKLNIAMGMIEAARRDKQ